MTKNLQARLPAELEALIESHKTDKSYLEELLSEAKKRESHQLIEQAKQHLDRINREKGSMLNILSFDAAERVVEHLGEKSSEVAKEEIRKISRDNIKTIIPSIPGNVFIDSPYKYDDSIKLALPELDLTDKRIKSADKDDAKKKSDVENAMLISSLLPGLTPLQATHSQLWLTILLFHQKEYALARFDKKDRWLSCSTNRTRTRHVISRLWYLNFVAFKSEMFTPEEMLQFLVDDYDRAAGIIERPTLSGSSAKATDGIITLVKRMEEEGIPSKREKRRVFMRRVTFVGKRHVLPYLEPEEIAGLLESTYKEIHNQ